MSYNFNPMPTTSGQGMFTGASSSGVVQGTAYPDGDGPSWYANRQGILNASETLPMWGGVGVFANIPGGSGQPASGLGQQVGRATAATGSKALAGFSVFDRAYNYINTPQSPVGIAQPGMSVMWYPLGSRVRLALACDPILADLIGDPSSTSVAWDYVNQELIPYLASGTIASGTYNSTTGIASLTTSAAHGLGVGDSVTISSATGTGSYADLNGTFTTLAGTAGETINVQLPTTLTMTITGGSVTTGPALSGVQVLNVFQTNCMTVDYNTGTGFATWDYDGSCAVVQI